LECSFVRALMKPLIEENDFMDCKFFNWPKLT
jgi:hypothetical protein